MSGDNTLSKRGAALENQFFAEVDEKLTAAMKAELEKTSAIEELAKLSGIRDERVLKSIVGAGVAPTTFPALRLFPLVAVAWADGMLQAGERDVVLSAAGKHCVESKSPSGRLLQKWLETEPPKELFEAWESFARALVMQLAPAEAATLKISVLAEVKQVAEASGGVLGWSSISRGEHAVMNRIEAALTRS
jgi:hypothetical protein